MAALEFGKRSSRPRAATRPLRQARGDLSTAQPRAREATAMQQFLNQLLQFLQQGIAAIFRFVELVWSWSVGQISTLTRVPWQDWPLWKQVLLVLIIAGIVYALLKVAVELWQAGERILAAFATLLGVLVKTLPSVMIAGVI